MTNFNSEHKTILDDLLLGLPHVRAGKMFGFPAYYVGKKLCICLYEQGVGAKLPEQSAAKLLRAEPNTVPFRPLGKPKMREERVQINLLRSDDYRQYKSVFEESIRFLLGNSSGFNKWKRLTGIPTISRNHPLSGLVHRPSLCYQPDIAFQVFSH